MSEVVNGLTDCVMAAATKGRNESISEIPVKTGGRLIRHGWHFILQLAENELTPTLSGQILRRIRWMMEESSARSQ